MVILQLLFKDTLESIFRKCFRKCWVFVFPLNCPGHVLILCFTPTVLSSRGQCVPPTQSSEQLHDKKNNEKDDSKCA